MKGKRKNDCNCQMMERKKPDKTDGQFHLVNELIHQGWSEIFLACRLCGRIWKVEEDMGYHYPIYHGVTSPTIPPTTKFENKSQPEC